MNILILDTYYPAFLSDFYNRAIPFLSYEEHWRSLMDECFGTADFYSHNLRLLGHEATEIVANCEPLQRQWALEHGISLNQKKGRWSIVKRRGILPWPRYVPDSVWFYDVLRAQVRHYRPDVLYVQDMNRISADFLSEAKSTVRLIVGQTAYPLAPNIDLAPYDLILTSFPHYVQMFQAKGISSAYFQLAFEPRVLEHLKATQNVSGGKTYEAVFAGGLSPEHAERLRFLESVAAAVPLDIWGYGAQTLPPDSALQQRHHGPAWALAMYHVLADARVALNSHINVAGVYANNMRLYEATGVGTLLLTDWKENLHTIYEPGNEVVAYRSTEECIELLKHFLSHEDERKAIAKSGQRRTLQEHTYANRMTELLGILHAHV